MVLVEKIVRVTSYGSDDEKLSRKHQENVLNRARQVQTRLPSEIGDGYLERERGEVNSLSSLLLTFFAAVVGA